MWLHKSNQNCEATSVWSAVACTERQKTKITQTTFESQDLRVIMSKCMRTTTKQFKSSLKRSWRKKLSRKLIKKDKIWTKHQTQRSKLMKISISMEAAPQKPMHSYVWKWCRRHANKSARHGDRTCIGRGCNIIQTNHAVLKEKWKSALPCWMSSKTHPVNSYEILFSPPATLVFKACIMWESVLLIAGCETSDNWGRFWYISKLSNPAMQAF